MPTVVFIHGTFAAGPEEGDQWWQRGSDFERFLRDGVEPEKGALSFQRLHWDGHNSEVSRRAAALELFERCKALEAAEERYVLIGHSHGGSVISDTLLIASEAQSPLPNLSQTITVGTPFLRVSKPSILSKLSAPLVLILILLTALGVAVHSTTTQGGTLHSQLVLLDEGFSKSKPLLGCERGASQFRSRLGLQQDGLTEKTKQLICEDYEKTAEPLAMSIIYQAYLFLALLVGVDVVPKLFRGLHKKDKSINPKNVRRTKDIFSSRWLGFAHDSDEAVYGLSRLISTTPYSFEFTSRRISNYSMTLFGLSILIVLFFTATWLLLFSAANELPPSLMSATYFLDLASKLMESPGRAVKIGLPLALICAGTVLVIAMVWLLSKWAVDQIAERFKEFALGMDFPGQRAVDVSAKPMWSENEPAVIPDEVAAELTTFDDYQSAAFVRGLRKELNALLKQGTGAELRCLFEVLGAFELTHTNYFKSPLFRKLVFAALVERAGFHATHAMNSDPDFKRLRQHLNALQTTLLGSQA
jgi:hypothetical protein